MYQTIGESIEMIVVYGSSLPGQVGRLKPLRFRWQGRVYPVHQITLATDTKDGGIRKRLYSVVSRGNVYRLSFNRDNEEWALEEIWLEG